MKKICLFVILLLAVAFTFIACTKKPTLHLFCWADYISPDLIKQFEKENDCKVVYDTFDSNEALLAKIQAGASGYDLMFPSHYIVNILAKSGKIIELDHSKITILNSIDPEVLASLPDKDCKYSVPYMISYTGLGYVKDRVPDFKPSWTMFERSDLQKRAVLLDDKREVIGAALLSLGLNPNSTDKEDLLKAKEVIKKWLKNVSKFENEQYKNGVATREFFLVMGYSGDLGQIVEEYDHVEFAIPEEGCLMNCDVLCIPTTAKNPDLAYKFINFIHTPENVKENIEFTVYLCPNKDAYALLPKEVRENTMIFISPELFKKSYFTADQGENEGVYNELWQDIKSGL